MKKSARELYDEFKLGKLADGTAVEVTGIVRAVEADRQNGKLTIEGGDKPGDRMEVFFAGPVTGVNRRDTVTVTVNGKIDGVLTLTDANLVSVTSKK